MTTVRGGELTKWCFFGTVRFTMESQCHFLYTSHNSCMEASSALLSFCAGNSPVTGDKSRSSDHQNDIPISLHELKIWYMFRIWVDIWYTIACYIGPRFNDSQPAILPSTDSDIQSTLELVTHDDVIKWKHVPRNWPFVRGIHRSRWIPHTKASDAELWCFIWSASE